MIYSDIYSSTYEIRLQMILPEHVSPDTLQEWGHGTIPKDRTGQPTIPGKCLYTIPDIGMVVNIITMSNEGGVNCPERRQTTKHDY